MFPYATQFLEAYPLLISFRFQGGPLLTPDAALPTEVQQNGSNATNPVTVRARRLVDVYKGLNDSPTMPSPIINHNLVKMEEDTDQINRIDRFREVLEQDKLELVDTLDTEGEVWKFVFLKKCWGIHAFI